MAAKVSRVGGNKPPAEVCAVLQPNGYWQYYDSIEAAAVDMHACANMDAVVHVYKPDRTIKLSLTVGEEPVKKGTGGSQ